MYEFEINNKRTNEIAFIFGYTEKDAWRRHPELDPNDWKTVHCEYID